jgi:energy-converting hydrogenase Eha subunit A
MFLYRLRTLLIAVTVVGLFIGLYVNVWRFDHFLPALFTTTVTAASFLAIQRRCQGNERLGAILGGAVGGILSIVLHKIACDVLLPGVYEDEGLPLFEYTLLFSPVGAVCGMIVGLFVWMLAFLAKLDAAN